MEPSEEEIPIGEVLLVYLVPPFNCLGLMVASLDWSDESGRYFRRLYAAPWIYLARSLVRLINYIGRV